MSRPFLLLPRTACVSRGRAQPVPSWRRAIHTSAERCRIAADCPVETSGCRGRSRLPRTASTTKGGCVHPRMLCIGLAALLTLAVSTAVAGGGRGAAEERIVACQKPGGFLRVVASASRCRAGETVVAWNTRGPAGAQGPAGPGPGRTGRTPGRAGSRGSGWLSRGAGPARTLGSTGSSWATGSTRLGNRLDRRPRRTGLRSRGRCFRDGRCLHDLRRPHRAALHRRHVTASPSAATSTSASSTTATDDRPRHQRDRLRPGRK